MMDRPARLVAGVIGAGPMGCVLGEALNNAGHTVAGVAPWPAESTGTPGDREVRARHLPDTPDLAPEALAAGVDLLLIAVPEDEVPAVVRRLDEAGAWRPGQIVLHTGFTEGTTLMPQAASAHILPIAFLPAVDLLGAPGDRERFRGSPVVVAGPEELRPVGEALVIEMGAEPAWVRPADAARMRAALTLVRTSLDVAFAGAQELLEETDISSAVRVLAATIGSRADAIHHGAGSDVAARPLGKPAAMRTDLALLGERLGPGHREIHAGMLRAAVTAAVLDGRIETTRMEEFLDVLATPDEGAAGHDDA